MALDGLKFRVFGCEAPGNDTKSSISENLAFHEKLLFNFAMKNKNFGI